MRRTDSGLRGPATATPPPPHSARAEPPHGLEVAVEDLVGRAVGGLAVQGSAVGDPGIAFHGVVGRPDAHRGGLRGHLTQHCPWPQIGVAGGVAGLDRPVQRCRQLAGCDVDRGHDAGLVEAQAGCGGGGGLKRASCRRHACRGRSGSSAPSGHPPRSRSPGRGEGGRDQLRHPGPKGGQAATPACRAPARVLRTPRPSTPPSPAPWPLPSAARRRGRCRRDHRESLRVEPVANHRRTTAGDRAAEGVEDQPACAGLDVRGQPAGTSIDQLTQHDCGHRPPHNS